MLNNLRLALGLALKVHSNLAKKLKPKSQNVLGLILIIKKKWQGKTWYELRILVLLPPVPIFNRGSCCTSKKKLQNIEGFTIEYLFFCFLSLCFLQIIITSTSYQQLLLKEC